MLKVNWLEPGSPEVAAALAELPACEMCSHALYQRLLMLPRRETVRVALVKQGHASIAAIGLVKHTRLLWEPVANWLFPGPSFPALPGRHVDALAAVGVEMPIAWWRMAQAPPTGRNIHRLEITKSHRIDDLAKREEFWRSTDYLRHIRNIRNRAKGLEIRIGVPEIAEHVTAGWHAKWTGGGADDFRVKARALLAQALEAEGRHLTVGLYDEGELAAGSTNFIHRGELVAGILYAPDSHRRIGAGVRLIDLMFEIAEARGLKAFDLGGAAEYKRKWAPAVGERASFVIAPPAMRLARQLVVKARALVKGEAPPVAAVATE